SMKSVLYVRATSSEVCMTHTGSQVGPQGPSGPPPCRQFVDEPRLAALTICNPACPGVVHGGLGWACARIMYLIYRSELNPGVYVSNCVPSPQLASTVLRCI